MDKAKTDGNLAEARELIAMEKRERATKCLEKISAALNEYACDLAVVVLAQPQPNNFIFGIDVRPKDIEITKPDTQ